MGVIQGLSEFLPISSSAHIVFTSSIYKLFTGVDLDLASSQEVFLAIMLHLGTLISVLIFFRKEIFDILKAFFIALKNRNFEDKDAKMGLYIIIGTFFTVLVAYPLKDITEKLVFSPIVPSLLLIGTGGLLFLSEYVSSKFKAKTDKINLKTAVIIGIAQGLAAFPGFSRSGFTIAAGLFSGLDRISCTKYSFLLTIPIILGTSIFYPVLEIDKADFITYNWVAIIIGTLISTIVGYLCIKYFLKFVAKFSLNIFAYYCISVGALMSILFYIKG